MTLSIILCSLAGLALAAPMEYPLERVTDTIYVIYGTADLPNEINHGFRNNVVVVKTSKGVVLFDPGGSNRAGEMVLHKLMALTTQPVVAVFNSHAHGDHWLANEAIKSAYPKVTIYGHKNTQTRINGAEGQFWLNTINKLTKGTANGLKVVAPNKTVADGDVVAIGDTQFRIFHPDKAHTDSDIMIEIVGSGVLFTGDVVRNGMLGIMEEDASFSGNIKAINMLVSNNFKILIPGHGKTGGNQIALNYRDYLQGILGNVKKYYETGMADFEMKPKILTDVSRFKSWDGFDLRLGSHISRAYLEVEKEAF